VKIVPTQEKAEAIAELKEKVQASKLVVMTKYVGIRADQSESLRKKLRDEKVSLKVYKNTLAKRVLDELGYGEAAAFMDGPTGWAFSTDPVAPAKVLKDFSKDVPLVEMVGGVLDGKVVTKAQLNALANLPPRQVLLGQVAGAVAAPISSLASILQALPRNLANALDQVRKQKEGAAA
jgi:large subunit ribosomal protein L10